MSEIEEYNRMTGQNIKSISEVPYAVRMNIIEYTEKYMHNMFSSTKIKGYKVLGKFYPYVEYKSESKHISTKRICPAFHPVRLVTRGEHAGTFWCDRCHDWHALKNTTAVRDYGY